MSDYLIKTVEDKKWLWFENTNNYLQIEEDVFSVLERLSKGHSVDDVSEWCSDKYQLSQEQANQTVLQINDVLTAQLKKRIETTDEEIKIAAPDSFYSSKIYKFHKAYFQFFYGNAELETMFHPLFAHLESDKTDTNLNQIRLFFEQYTYGLKINKDKTQVWPKNQDHLFKGQVFMALLNAAYSKKENEWMGVLHASAIGNEQNSVLFLGDSGNGKSTASAIALASGLALIADDFVPLDAGGKVLAFPAALSVKKQALAILSSHFPELLKAKEYELKAMNKTVRYLAPKMSSNSASRQVKSLVFIKYDSSIDFEFNKLDKHIAFQHLVVDSWLSPLEENARNFMDWIAELPTYLLRYSNNEKMIAKIKELLV